MKKVLLTTPAQELNSATLSSSEFNDQYNRISWGATAALSVGYKLNKRWSVIAGPQAQYMLSSMIKSANNTQYNYAYTFNAGVRWGLK